MIDVLREKTTKQCRGKSVQNDRNEAEKQQMCDKHKHEKNERRKERNFVREGE